MAKWNLANWRKTIHYLRRNGLRNTFYAVLERLEQSRVTPYCYQEPDDAELKQQRGYRFTTAPLFSILVPTYRTPEIYLIEMIESVLKQTYSNLELILADATEDESVEQVVRRIMDKESAEYGCQRIRYHRLSQNAGISENTNEALKLATGDYIGLLDHDDVLTPDALFCMAEQIKALADKGSKALLLYSDEDKCNQDRTEYFEPHFKQDFNLDLLLSNNYICHFTVMERELMQRIRFRGEYNGAQDFDLVLRAVAEILPEEEKIVHIPRVLYHWRCHTGSTAENPQSKTYAYEAGKRAVQDMARRMGWNAEAAHLKHLGFYELVYRPDLLSVRTDVGAVGGRLMHGRKLAYGAYDMQGEVLYKGLKKGYSGYMHRGVLLQDAAAVDIRLIQVRPECRELFREVTGVPYVTGKNNAFDWTTLPKGIDYSALSIKLGEALRSAGYRICWNPDWSSRWSSH